MVDDHRSELLKAIDSYKSIVKDKDTIYRVLEKSIEVYNLKIILYLLIRRIRTSLRK